MTGPHRWWLRIATAAFAFAAIEGALMVTHGDADELRLALVVALVVCAFALLVDATPVQPATWTPHVEPEDGLVRLDPRTASYLRILEGHISAREADVGLRGRLRELADQTLRVRHDFGVDDPRAAELLGTELREVLTGPPRRLDPDQIERCVRRIEEL
jgi:hypothetical protein